MNWLNRLNGSQVHTGFLASGTSGGGGGVARAPDTSPSLNSNERKELLVGEVPTGEQLFYLSFDEFREWGVVGVARAPPPHLPPL